MKSFMANPSNIERKWFVVDAADKTLGRMAAEVAKILRGKHKPTFTPHMDTGDRLGSQIYTKLHVYAGSEHPHAAQKPETLEINVR